MTQPDPQSNATNSQKNHNNPKTVISDTTCPHGHTTFVQYVNAPWRNVPNWAPFGYEMSLSGSCEGITPHSTVHKDKLEHGGMKST
jgi:hypothetical protein